MVKLKVAVMVVLGVSTGTVVEFVELVTSATVFMVVDGIIVVVRLKVAVVVVLGVVVGTVELVTAATAVVLVDGLTVVV